MRTLSTVLIYAALGAISLFAQTGNPAPATSPRPLAAEIGQLQDDVTKMRSLITQMQMNLPFAAATENPLKHQFELDIEMWSLLLDSMQRRLDRLRSAAPPASAPEPVRAPQDGRKNPQRSGGQVKEP